MTEANVEWRPVVGYERYKVSSNGQVTGPRGEVMSGGITTAGYPCVCLRSDGTRTTKAVHQLVAMAVIGPANGLEVRHLDGDPRNNNLSNLAYGTHSENMIDRVSHGRDPHSLKTECKHGHAFTPENTYTSPNRNGRPRRGCRECTRIRQSRALATLHLTSEGDKKNG